MLLKNTIEKIKDKFCEVLPVLEQRNADVIERINECNKEQQILMQFLYESMTISDMADYDFNTYLAYIDHALFLKKNMNWCTSIPDDIFLNYVLYYRINNEDIEDCRKLFYDSLHERINGKTMSEAALEVNYWCAENVVYRSTDVRTASPLTVWRTGSGRCGEESTFTVAAMRSVGIPARQIYTPRWSHCDDNHAWVEVWCDGRWYYLGACEPEPVFDRGWFTEAASRAMFIHSRIFSPIILNEEIVGRHGKTTVLNNIERYASARKFTVRVIDSEKRPVAGIEVKFDVLNQSEFFSVASKLTDEQGNAEITLGLADIHIHVNHEEQYYECFADTSKITCIDLTLNRTDMNITSSYDFKISVPEGENSRRIPLTAEQNEAKKYKINHADKVREEKIAGFYHEQEANEAIKKYSCKEEIKAIIYKARGNFKEIINYLNAFVDNDNPHLRIKLLMALSDKDFCDLKSETLLEHFIIALRFSERYDENIFVKYVLCPRIYFEKMTPYREFINDYFNEKTKECFQNNPQLVWDFITNEISTIEHMEYEELFTSPCGILKAKCGSLLSKRMLFTAICRTIGIPARINPVTLFPEYYQLGEFVSVEKEGECVAKLLIRALDNTNWLYMQNWTIAILENGEYRTLDLSGAAWLNGSLAIDIPVGFYRLLVSNRMPNGNILARKYCFVCEENQTTKISIVLPEAEIADLLEYVPFPSFTLTDMHQKVYTVKELVRDEPTVIVWLEEGKEPTEHILNEMIAHCNEFIGIEGKFVFVLRDKNTLQNATLQKALKAGLNIALYYGDFVEEAAAVAKSLYRDSEKLPLVLVSSDGEHALYSFSGYNVGIADLLVKILNAIR